MIFHERLHIQGPLFAASQLILMQADQQQGRKQISAAWSCIPSVIEVGVALTIRQVLSRNLAIRDRGGSAGWLRGSRGIDMIWRGWAPMGDVN